MLKFDHSKALPAAAYIKSQAYVPLLQSRHVSHHLPMRDCLLKCCRSAHFIDPFLRAILESSLTPDDNDLFLSNLVNAPLLAVHG